MSAPLERALLAAVVALAPAADRESLAGDLLEAAAESCARGSLLREALRSLPALLGWRVRRLGAPGLLLAALAGAVAAGLALAAVGSAWHLVLSMVPRRAGHAMTGGWICVDATLAALAGTVGAGFGARLGRCLWGGRSG